MPFWCTRVHIAVVATKSSIQWSGLWYQLTAFEDIGVFNFWAEQVNFKYKNQIYLIFHHQQNIILFLMAFICNQTSYICLESPLVASNACPIWDQIWYLPEFGRRSLLTNIRRERSRLVNDAVQRAENHFECKIVQCSSLIAQELGQPCVIQVVLVSVSTETWGTAM